MIRETPLSELDGWIRKSWETFQVYRKTSLKERADLMREVARELQAATSELIPTAMRETNLPEPRLENEKNRTIFQLNSYADACEKGIWLEAAIDTANADRQPPKPDLRKSRIPIGPTAVFGASNFPFAYSTAGGDTACALAAGCTVVLKAHPGHPETSEIVAQAIWKALDTCHFPSSVFTHVFGSGIETGRYLVSHPMIKAVGFTGSFQGGKALFDLANARKEPIPVFAEMGSINPIIILPGKLLEDPVGIAKMVAGSITLGVGQFCTNPGILIGLEGESLNHFCKALSTEIQKVVPGRMLHPGIYNSYQEKREIALTQEGVDLLSISEIQAGPFGALPTVATVNGEQFLGNPVLHQEVFGPYSLVVRCRDKAGMLSILRRLEGQLTTSFFANDADLQDGDDLLKAAEQICGRIILNGVPTGVEVCQSMHHGGPFPASTDSRFTSVGSDGIKRFSRPISFQNWPDSLLPPELKNENPNHIWRTVNNQLTDGSLH